MTDIGHLVRAANPVPDDSSALTDDELGAVFLLAQQRSTDMDIKEMTTPVTPDEKPKRGWLIAVAAAAVVVLIIGAVAVIAQQADDTAPATPSTTIGPTPTTTVASDADNGPSTTVAASPTEVTTTSEATIPQAHLDFVTAFEDAFNSGDANAFRSLFAPTAVRILDEDISLNEDLDLIVADMFFLHERGTTVRLVDCSPVAAGLSCTTTQTGPVEEALYGVDVASRDIYSLDEDGTVLSVKWGYNDPVGPGRDPDFHDWMASEHPEAAADLDDCCGWSRSAGDDAAVYREWIPVWVEAGRP